MAWHRISSVDEIPESGSRRMFRIDDREFTVLRTREGLFCIDYRCPHTGGPLGDGLVAGRSITCPLHRWRFDLTDGSHSHEQQSGLAGVYQLRIDGSDLMVEL